MNIDELAEKHAGLAVEVMHECGHTDLYWTFPKLGGDVRWLKCKNCTKYYRMLLHNSPEGKLTLTGIYPAGTCGAEGGNA